MGNAEPQKPLTIRMHELDNVEIVANDCGLSAGAKLASGLTLREHVPQGHKVAMEDLAEGAPVAIAVLGGSLESAKAAVTPSGKRPKP